MRVVLVWRKGAPNYNALQFRKLVGLYWLRFESRFRISFITTLTNSFNFETVSRSSEHKLYNIPNCVMSLWKDVIKRDISFDLQWVIGRVISSKKWLYWTVFYNYWLGPFCFFNIYFSTFLQNAIKNLFFNLVRRYNLDFEIKKLKHANISSISILWRLSFVRIMLRSHFIS